MNMSEEVQETAVDEKVVTPTSDTDSVNSLDDVDDPKTLKKVIRELRGENAKHRQKNNDQAAQLSEYNEWKKSQLSETDRAKAEKEELAKELKTAWRETLGLKYGLDEDLYEFIDGDTKDEMEAKAKKLAGKKPGAGGAPTDGNAYLFGGSRGQALGKDEKGGTAKAVSGGDFLKELYDTNGRTS